ncbi:MAG: fumarylacetoacetase [Planctomycetota bacterium]|nr:fumarylacetoacetase [Planctomycetota bacterium]
MSSTTDPGLKTWIKCGKDTHFPIQNLPYGVFQPKDGGSPRVGVAIGEYVLDLSDLERRGYVSASGKGAASGSDFGADSFMGVLGTGTDQVVFDRPSLNDFMASGPEVWSQTRQAVSALLTGDDPRLKEDREFQAAALYRQEEVELLLPVEVADYTDFYSSKYHAVNVGTIMRGADNALMPNYVHLPIAYHGRAGSIVVSGTPVRRPMGQTKKDEDPAPGFGASRLMDFELEVGCLIGAPSEQGSPVGVPEAPRHIFGMVLVNDWSARDIQKWEYQPLGPFNAKNFATSISPWVVPLEALLPFRCGGPKQDPEPLPYLRSTAPWAVDINLEVWLQGQEMDQPHRICSTNYKHMYWNICQQVAHHTVGGCNLRTGDLLASGTVSGPEPDSYGSMLELAWRGTKPLKLPGGGERKFLEDGDTVILTGWCQGKGYRVGFGECRGTVLPARG